MRFVAVLSAILLLFAATTYGNEPMYEANCVIAGVPVEGDSAFGVFQSVTRMVETMIGIELQTQDSLQFICNMVWEEEEYDGVQKLIWEDVELEETSVEDVVAAYLALGVFAQPNYMHRVFQYVGHQAPPPSFPSNGTALDPESHRQVPYSLGGLDPISGLRYTEVVRSWSLLPPEEGREEIILSINDTGALWWHREIGDRLYQNLGEDADGDGSVLIPLGNERYFDPEDVNGVDDDGNGLVDDFVGWDFFYYGNDPAPDTDLDPFVHGHAVSSVAAAANFNGTGMFGVAAPPVKLNIVRTGTGPWIYSWPAVQAIGLDIEKFLNREWHVVTNFSWGSLYEDPLLEHQIECFRREGGLPVFAAGNYGNQWQTFPAAHQLGLIVTASNPSNERAVWSSHGNWTWPNGLAAPGEDVLVMIANIFMGDITFRYDLSEGTSFSAPLVAGLAANYWSAHPELTNEEVMEAVLQSVYKPEDYPEVNPDPYSVPNYYGRGIVDAGALFGGR